MRYFFKYYLVFCSISLLISCQAIDKWDTIDVLSVSQRLDIQEILYTFDDALPVWMSVQDSVMFINLARSSKAAVALDIRTKSLINSFGEIGRGPNEVIGPELVAQMDSDELLLADVNTKKIVRIVQDTINKNYSLAGAMDYPEEIYPSSGLVFSENFISGRNMENEEAMFFIYNRTDRSSVDISCYPPVKNLQKRRSYFYAVRTAINEDANRIIAANYFFNMFHIYTLQGDYVKSLALSENPIPPVDPQSNEIDFREELTGIQALFPTEEYCYILLKTQNAKIQKDVRSEERRVGKESRCRRSPCQ